MSIFKSRYMVVVICLLFFCFISSNASAQEPVHQIFLPLISVPTPPDPFDKYSPADGAIDQDLILGLWWVSSENVTNYEYCIDTTNDDACSTWISTGLNNYGVPPQLGSNTTYYWQVRAWNGSVGPTYANGDPHSFWAFTTIDMNPAPFGKYSPVNGASDQDLVLDLWWIPSERATNYEYCMDTTNDNTCSNWISTGINNYTAPLQLTPSTTYYWQVRAWNDGHGPTYASGSPSAFWSFRTLHLNPTTFSKYSPLDGAIDQNVYLGLWWVPAERVTKYEYCIDTTNDETCTNWISTGTDNFVVPPPLSNFTTYYWQVRAWNGTFGPTYANGSPSAFWNFTTMDMNPGPFSKYSPLDGAIDQNVYLGLWWVPAERVTKYEYCIDTTDDNICTNWIFTGTSNSVTLTNLQPYTKYYWQVRAWNNTYGPIYANNGATDFWEFTTFAPDPIQNGGFESGDVVWYVYSSNGFDLILNTTQDLPLSPHNGSWLAWLGGYPNETSYLFQYVTIPAGRSILQFWIFTASADLCGYDAFGVMVNDDVVYSQWVCDDNDTNGWVRRTVDLSYYAGQTVELSFLAGLDSLWNSNIFLDDISMESTFSLNDSFKEDFYTDVSRADPTLLDTMKEKQKEKIFLPKPDYKDELRLNEMLVRKMRGLRDQLLNE